MDGTPRTGLNVLSFLFLLVGLILYLVFLDKTPTKARSIGKSALIGFIIGVVLSVINMALLISYNIQKTPFHLKGSFFIPTQAPRLYSPHRGGEAAYSRLTMP